MDTNSALRRRHADLIVQKTGTETLVYDERRHKAFCLNATSSAVWELADGTRTFDEIAAGASTHHGGEVSPEVVAMAIAQLHEEGLLEAGTPDAARGEQVQLSIQVSRRSVLQGLGAGGAMLLPAIAAILAPTAAEAYSGCFDCPAPSATPAQQARARQAAAARASQLAQPAVTGAAPASHGTGTQTPPSPPEGQP
jgi:hypothetical protein